MAVTFLRQSDGDLSEIGRVEDGAITDDTDSLVENSTAGMDLSDEDALVERFDGPRIFARRDDTDQSRAASVRDRLGL